MVRCFSTALPNLAEARQRFGDFILPVWRKDKELACRQLTEQAGVTLDQTAGVGDDSIF